MKITGIAALLCASAAFGGAAAVTLPIKASESMVRGTEWCINGRWLMMGALYLTATMRGTDDRIAGAEKLLRSRS